MEMRQGFFTTVAAFGLFAVTAFAADQPATLNVDATAAARGLLHATMHIPAAPGKLTLYYPKWIPGEHSPSGPVNNVTGLKFSALGQPLDWRRDAEDMFTLQLTVPPGADAVDVAFDFLLAAGGGGYSASGSSTPHLLVLSWNQLLFYPPSAAPLKTLFVASLKLPAGWQFGTALPVGTTTRSHPDEIEFAAAPLETLIDSPVLAGEFFRTIDLAPGDKITRQLHIAADAAANLEIKPEDEARFAKLLREAEALFGARHYRDYHFLLTLSEHVAHFGLEHHESSDNRTAENFLTDNDARAAAADLLPHELTHSWNGKFRRPAGLATPDYQQPMHGELLWVYEGLTDYLGKVLAARSGLMTTTNFHAAFALTAARMDVRDGRKWRSLADTAIAAQLLYDAPGTGDSRRRNVDFYPEGDLIWLEADTIIRQQTKGKKSLDNFCQAFHGGKNSDPKVVPYTFDDVIQALNEAAAYDWKNFFQQRVYDVAPRAPIGGIENGGWKLTYTNEVPAWLKIREGQRKLIDLNYSLGFGVSNDGGIGDVLPGSPADQAGINQGMKLVAVNGRAYSDKILREAVSAATTNQAPLNLLTLENDFYTMRAVNYHGGEKYPVLVRDAAKPDWIAEIIKPLTPDLGTNSPAKK
jgi:predicted metalloprotease with PDZ domain